MERVKCRECAMIANTASPDYALCQCGGKLRRLKIRAQIKKRTTFSPSRRLQWQGTRK